MKFQIMIPISIALSVASFAMIKIRLPLLAAEEKRNTMLDVKLRVTEELLGEFEKEKNIIDSRIETEKSAQEPLQKEITELSTNTKKEELDTCLGLKKGFTDEETSAQDQINTFQIESAKEKTAWEAEMETLKGTLNTQSPICNFLKTGASLPGVCPKKEEAKPEEAKVEPPKAEEPKPEAPKPEEAKPAEAKPAEAKPAEAKPEEAKPAEAKPEAPKQ
ncbi:hypothetical protein NQD34_012255 [Periophthalmus magnuspinnatus]|uniref:anti-sigma-I factor RsgI8 n=1 Tax=Periophthalmus magnuspinnatus TaxID=409849 RepID=UPI00145A839F|nr:anti-sigma-I factor RsgI8 [Periophthalmus magnuspinnatus]KAJ0000413.1 hypothetical protein NQD34_012255 [Periophthalmus magnuspinnatus]